MQKLQTRNACNKNCAHSITPSKQQGHKIRKEFHECVSWIVNSMHILLKFETINNNRELLVCFRMGQIQKQSQHKNTVQSINYDVDLHSIEFTLDLPSSFPYTMQKVIQEVEQFLKDSDTHPLEVFITYEIDKRFSRYNAIDELAFHKQKSIYSVISINPNLSQSIGWRELQTQQNFYKLLTHLEMQYNQQTIFLELYFKSQSLSQLTKQINSQGITLRKPLPATGQQTHQLSAQLFKRLFYRYYQNVLKNYANTSLKERVLKFHNEIGKLLCLIVTKDYFQFSQLYELVYCMICIDKEGLELNDKFSFLRKKYFKFCLQKKYIVDVQESRIKVLQSAVRLYLDQLYMNSTLEAQDPQIKESEDDLLNPTKTFPIQKVKEKYKQ